MSLENKLRAAATAAAMEAMTNERARCLWCVDEVLKELRAQLDKKLLTAIQIHGVELKIQIAEGLAVRVRRAIVSGVRPVSNRSEPGPAIFPDQRCRICQRLLDDPRGCDKSLPHHEADRLKP